MRGKTVLSWFVLAPALIAGTIPGRYIVELTTEPVAEHVSRLPQRAAMRGAAALTHRARVRSQQLEVRRQLEQRQARVLGSVDTVANALFVEAPDEAAAQLVPVAGVKRVVPVRTMHMLLDRAVLVHKVADVWSQVGDGRAGAGVKIAVIDSGIEVTHPGFQDSSLAMPESFPRANNTADLAYTNSKVIVARSYVGMLPYRDPDPSPRDRVGHGTALAMIAAGARNAGPLATIAGVAPKAYLGNYKVFGTPGYNDASSDDAVLKAIDDAVADGMDVISLSLGDDLAPRLSDDLDVQAVERASKAGVIVVVAAGNNGPDLNTIASPATAPSAIAVGAATNDRTFAASAEVPGLSTFLAVPGSGPAPSTPVTATIADVSTIDGNGLACTALPASSLSGSIALILRGSCTFEIKLNNAQRAGAVAALVYAAQDSPDPVAMSIGPASLPAEMISYADAMAIKQGFAAQSTVVGTLRFAASAVPIDAKRLMDFSAAGPNVDSGIKPDLVAVGGDVYSATQTLDFRGEMYDPSGYAVADGTSFSAPFVAGAVALIQSARPGLTVDQYRSLLINTAAEAFTHSGQTPGVQQAGAGLLDAAAALSSTVTAYPTSLSLGTGNGDPRMSRTLTLTNVGTAAETYTIWAAARPGAPVPAFSASTLELAAGASAELTVSWNQTALTPGAYEGFITVSGSSSGTQAKVPYWYAVGSGVPATITILDRATGGRRGSVLNSAVLFRVTDAAGAPLTEIRPQVIVVSGGGLVRRVTSRDSSVPGLFVIDAQLGPAAGTNVLRIQAGDVTLDISIAGR